MAERICSVSDCGKPALTRGWCKTHYSRWVRHGSTDLPPRRRSAEDRFWAKVDKNGPVPDYAPHLGPCWLWTGSTNSVSGYARFGFDGKTSYGHRFAVIHIAGRPIPEGMFTDHLCRVVRCVNPDHLEVVTPSQNTRRSPIHPFMRVRTPPTHCPQGHPYDEANTAWYVEKGGRRKRQCRTCGRERALRYYHANKGVREEPSCHG